MPRGIPTRGFRMTKNRVKEMEVEQPFQRSMFTINQRFTFIDDMVTMLANGSQASVIVTGAGGLGKSHTVTQALHKAGYTDISSVDEEDLEYYEGEDVYRVVKGYSSPRGLYRTLYENKDSVIVFDDCDSVLNNPVSLNILKAALDSYSTRIISWNAESRGEDNLPKSFEFTGRVVFISNMTSNSIDQAIISRSMAVDVTMTIEEKIERMIYLLDQSDFMPEYEIEYKADAMDLICNLMHRIKDLSLRTLIQCVKIRKDNPNGNWKDLATYAMCG